MNRWLNSAVGLLVLCFATSSVAQSPQFTAVTVSHAPPGNGCSVVQTRDQLKTTLKALGYTSPNLPKVDFDSMAAVVIATRDGSVTPVTYSAIGSFVISGHAPEIAAIKVLARPVAPDPTNSVFVMTIDKADGAATSCLLRFQTTHPSNIDVFSNPYPISPGRSNSEQKVPLATGGASTTSAMPTASPF